MKRLFRRLLLCALIAGMIWSGALIRDRRLLRQSLIRFHVVARSDAPEDQALKLRVRDAVLCSLRSDLEGLTDMGEARNYLSAALPKIRETAHRTLRAAGCPCPVTVTLGEEVFDVRHYDTFSLPAGVYESLRIVIGEGAGHNWWCVTFPSLCLPADTEEFEDVAVTAGFGRQLTRTLSAGEDYQVRFFLLDKLGQLENSLFPG